MGHILFLDKIIPFTAVYIASSKCKGIGWIWDSYANPWHNKGFAYWEAKLKWKNSSRSKMSQLRTYVLYSHLSTPNDQWEGMYIVSSLLH